MLWLSLFAWIPLVLSRSVNITIDDTYGDARTGAHPLYDAPGNQWLARRPGDCSSCGAQPDGSRVHNGTWHDKTTFVNENPATITFSFNGTSVWIYCILPNNIEFTDTRLSFEVDGITSSAAGFLHAADTSSNGYIYDQLVYASGTLDAGVHTVIVTNQASSIYEYGDTRYIGSIILFDYAIYTTEDPDESTSALGLTTHYDSSSSSTAPPSRAHPSSVNIGAIIGGTVGGVAVVLLCFLIALWRLIKWRRRRILATASEPETPAQDPSEREGFISDYQSYTQQTTPSSYSATFSSPPASAGLPVGDGVDYRRSVKKSPIVMEADREQGHALSVQELREEMGQMRSELELLKTTSVPPQYAV